MATNSKGDRDTGVCISLIRDAVISMASCFDKRHPVYLNPAVVYATVPGAMEYFNWLKNMRDNWIVHRGGPHRQCSAAVFIDERTGGFQGFGHLFHMYYGPKIEAGDDLIKNDDDCSRVRGGGIGKTRRVGERGRSDVEEL